MCENEDFILIIIIILYSTCTHGPIYQTAPCLKLKILRFLLFLSAIPLHAMKSCLLYPYGFYLVMRQYYYKII